MTNNKENNTATNKQLTDAERIELEELRAYKQKQSQVGNPLKVSAKGGVSVYGLGRFPVTLYKSQWKKLLGQAKEIAQFIVDHDSELAHKE
jgi:hypothetical protein